MWPWEHVAIGYLAVSALARGREDRAPTDGEAVAVVAASLAPDLIDKPLAWEFRVFESGYGLGHSAFFAVPVALAAIGVARSRGRAGVGAAFGVAYLLHLPADLALGYVTAGDLPVARILWPVYSEESTYTEGFSGTLAEYLGEYVHAVLSGDVGTLAAVGIAAFVGCVGVWLRDGAPGLFGLPDRLRGR